MKLSFLIALATMIAMGSLGEFVSKVETGRNLADKAKADKVREATVTIRWDGPKKMFCQSKIFRVGGQRVCLLVSN